MRDRLKTELGLLARLLGIQQLKIIADDAPGFAQEALVIEALNTKELR